MRTTGFGVQSHGNNGRQRQVLSGLVDRNGRYSQGMQAYGPERYRNSALGRSQHQSVLTHVYSYPLAQHSTSTHDHLRGISEGRQDERTERKECRTERYAQRYTAQNGLLTTIDNLSPSWSHRALETKS